jgi:hypothetical protein
VNADDLIALSDVELAQRFSDLVGEVFDVDEALGDQLFAFLGETLERWSPELGRARDRAPVARRPPGRASRRDRGHAPARGRSDAARRARCLRVAQPCGRL